jgi:TonB-dependent starch-binding outer membrane protein SusC
MQKLIRHCLLSAMFLHFSSTLYSQKWEAQVILNFRDEQLMRSVQLINKSQKKTTNSDDKGYFKLKARQGDSISIVVPVSDYMFSPSDTTFIWNGVDQLIHFQVQQMACIYWSYYNEPIQRSKIKHQFFTPGNVYNPYQLIQGKIPGVVVSRPGGDPNYDYQVQIRGLHSAIYSGFAYFPTANGYNQQFNHTQPLVEVDGIPGLTLQTIDPQDVASIEVIKDAASLALYGMRGANGVIKIQTKRSLQNRGLVYSTYLAMDRASNPDRGIDASTYRKLIGNNGTFQGLNRDLGANNDWYQLISRTGFSQAHNLALNGTALGSSYRLALNFRNVNGVAQKSNFDQVNALFNFNKAIQKGKGKIEGLFSVNKRNNTEVNPDIFRNAALMNPTAPIFSDTQALSGTYYKPNVFGLSNPLAILNWQTFENSFQTATAGLKAEFELLAGFKGKVHTAFQHNRDTYGWADSERIFGGYSGFSSWEERKLSHWYIDAQVAKTWAIQNHQIETQLGYTYQRWDGRGVRRDGISTSESLISYRPLINVQGKPDFLDREDPYRESDEMPAAYLQTLYTFKERWFAQGSLRREGFTRLGADKWVVYPALTLGGMLNPRNGPFSHLRFRVGYGITGNIPPKTYATELVVLPGGVPAYINGEFKPGIYYPFVPNPNLQAEQRKELNVRLEAALLKQRLQVQVELYRSHSSNLLWQYLISTEGAETAFSNTYFENRMELLNQGVEIQLHLAAIDNSTFKWQSDINVAHNRTVLNSSFPVSTLGITPVDRLPAGSPGSPGFCCSYLQLLETGKPIGQFYTYRSDGIDANGQWKTIDINSDGRVDEIADRQITGNAQPDLTLGWDNTLQWKQFTLNVFWRGAFGHDLLNAFNLFYANPQRLKDTPGYSIPEVALSPRFAKLRSNATPVSDYFVENASFLRLDNLSIAYNFPKSVQKKQHLSLYLSAQNLLTISSFTGNDPEVRLSNVGTPLLPGIVNPNYSGSNRDLSVFDRGRYPIAQTLVFGATLKL